MQVGSDGVQACGSCHFHAGVDNRTKNQLNPNHLGGDLNLDLKGPLANQDLAHRLSVPQAGQPAIPGEPLLIPGNVVSDSNDVVSSMGVRFRRFVDIPTPGPDAFFGPRRATACDRCCRISEVGRTPIRSRSSRASDGWSRATRPRSSPRRSTSTISGTAAPASTPTAAACSAPPTPVPCLRQRRGGALEGADNAHFRPDLEEENPEVAEQPVRIRFSSLASLATGPALSDFEMSFAGRNWPKIGKKLLQSGVTPLANQLVSTTDSVLGPYSNQRHRRPGSPGLSISYPAADRAGVQRRAVAQHGTQHARNGAAGLRSVRRVCAQGRPAGSGQSDRHQPVHPDGGELQPLLRPRLQAFLQLLIPDDTPFDRFMDANPTGRQRRRAAGRAGHAAAPRARSPAPASGNPLTLVPGGIRSG